ncbi:ankyrin repeat-containing domain protein [Phialemonium atrogriseum]|uniref:Ankyrin repeat-containing domain protein n=1 Tax=Phialemonium atrogriseum TaxID=1093897 RepID=A0AAJ0BSQ9_9PEZI|nr:ankyrin repeat-containing domain protein [Phialemonium atrogriseum]KAK1762337.1 ankyrin repeat-containing domain protein [Phialemonium atrogriseum]
MESHDDDGSIWGFVGTNREQSENGESDDGSMVMVARSSSPWPVDFRAIRNPIPPPVRLEWPPTLPWFQAQALYSRVRGTDHLQSPTAWRWLIDGAKLFPTPETSKTLMTAVGSRAVANMLTETGGIKLAAAELAKSMPESFEGEHMSRLEALIGDDPLEAKHAALRLLAYQVSNNLVQDDEDDPDDDKNERIVKMFRDVGLPSDLWVKTFSQNDQSTRAFAENLFEAAVNCRARDVMEALLESGVNPNQVVRSVMTGRLARPIQIAADSRVHDAEMAALLLRHGAGVDLTTEEEEKPAMHIAAGSATLDVVKVLAENGADIYGRCSPDFLEPVSTHTPLVCAANSAAYQERWYQEGRRSPQEANLPEERPSYQIFRYLLDLHRKAKFPSRNRSIYRDALVMAAFRGRIDFINLLRTVSVDASERTASGVSPLEAAAARAQRTVPTSSILLKMGAAASPPRRRGRRGEQPSALHIAASNDDAKLVQLLVDNGALVNDHVRLESWTDTGVLSRDYYYRNPEDSKPVFLHHHTPLQMALHSRTDMFRAGHKTGTSALILLSAGADLVGGELAQAVLIGNEDVIHALLDRGADPNDKGLDGLTALQAAISAGQEEIATILLRSGAKLCGGEMYLAVNAGQRKMVEALLERGSSLKDTSLTGSTLLEAACNSGCLTFLTEIAGEGRVTLRYDSGALCAAVLKGDLALVDELLKLRPRGRRNPVLEATALGIAAYTEQEPIFNRLLRLDNGFPTHCILPMPDDFHGHKAVILYRYTVSEAYKTTGFWHKPNMIRSSPLVPALLSKNHTLIQALLSAHHRPDPLSLLVAIRHHPPPTITTLLAHGADVSRPPRHDLDTPLQFSIRLRRLATARLLLSHGADPSALPAVLVPAYDPGTDDPPLPNAWRGRSAVQAAVETGDDDDGLLEELVSGRGVDVDGPVAADTGASALQLAAMAGRMGVARRLVGGGALVDRGRAERFGRTALEGAAEMGRLDMVHFLLERGARITGWWGTWQYLRAVGFARRNGHLAVARLLEGRRRWGRVNWARFENPGLLDEVFVLDQRPPRGFRSSTSNEDEEEEFDESEDDEEAYDDSEGDEEKREDEEGGEDEDEVVVVK